VLNVDVVFVKPLCLHPAVTIVTFVHSFIISALLFLLSHSLALFYSFIQGDSVVRGPKLLSIKNYVIEIMT